MIYGHWNHSQAPPKKPPHLSYIHYYKARHEFLTSSSNKRSIRDKNTEEQNEPHAIYFPKGASF